MKYDEFISNISRNEKFKIIQNSYDENFFGNFQIVLLFINELKLEIINDRGVIEIFILYEKIFRKCQIPLWFAIGYLESKEYTKRLVFENISSINEFLIKNIGVLELIVNNNIKEDIARDWIKYQNTF